MKIREIQKRDTKLNEQLLAIWEGAVKTTHTFLTTD